MAVDLDSAFAATEQKLEQAGKSLEDWIKHQQSVDRSAIALIVVTAFVVLIAIIVIAVLVGMLLYGGDWNKISEPAKFLMAILSSVLLPVVTLVVGHYFGSK